jgi:hypothetical protein
VSAETMLLTGYDRSKIPFSPLDKSWSHSRIIRATVDEISRLTDLVGPRGTVYALDLAAENIAAVQSRIGQKAFPCSVEASIGSVLNPPYHDNSFEELERMLKEFCRIFRPGGLIAVKDQDASNRLQPADPALLWRLYDAARSSPGPQGVQFRGLLRTSELRGWFTKVGLLEVWQRATVVERWAPLLPVEREFLGEVLSFAVELADQVGVPASDRETWHRLCGPESHNYILDHPDFYWREVHVVVAGRVPKKGRVEPGAVPDRGRT